MYNLTRIQGENVNLYELVLFGNEASQGMLVGGMMIAIFFIILFRLIRNAEFSSALLVSSFVCFFLSSLLSLAELVGIIFPLTFLAMLAFTGLYMFAARK
jgi:hypothetical protein